MFVDEADVLVSAGRGGDGAVTFHKEKYKPRGGPDGGNGGRGGSVILEAEEGSGSLGWLRDHPHQKATDGSPGRSNNRSGADGDDLVLPVPQGTVLSDEEGRMLADLAAPGDRYVVAAGGRGGRGNAAFLTDARRAPGFGELGEPGEACKVHLELRSIADVAVIGLPNAGKSTLVGALSGASPKVADYPFTTLEPTLGRVTHGEAPPFTICDIPGFIEGAHEGKGLGLGFLRHAARALAFVHLIDVSAERDPLADYRLIRQEVTSYSAEMADRPEVVTLNKTDAAEPEAVDAALARLAGVGLDPVAISAQTGQGLETLLERLGAVVAEQRAATDGLRGFELFRTEGRGLQVHRDQDGTWRLTGTAIERWVAMTDLSNAQAVSHLQERMDRAGVEQLLTKAGAHEGDEVRIGPAAFEWFPTPHRRTTRSPAGRP